MRPEVQDQSGHHGQAVVCVWCVWCVCGVCVWCGVCVCGVCVVCVCVLQASIVMLCNSLLSLPTLLQILKVPRSHVEKFIWSLSILF